MSAIVTSVSLLIVALVGIPMLWATWHGVRLFANVERHAANALLGRHVATAPIDAGHGNVWVRLRTMTQQRDRWRELAYLLLRFPAGVGTSTVAAVALATPVTVALAPVRSRFADHPFGDWALSSHMEAAAASPWSWLLVPLGVAMIVPSVHLLRRLADACGDWTAAWLTPAGDERATTP